MARDTRYLSFVGNSRHFDYLIPKRLQQWFKIRRLRHSLNTSDVDHAIKLRDTYLLLCVLACLGAANSVYGQTEKTPPANNQKNESASFDEPNEKELNAKLKIKRDQEQAAIATKLDVPRDQVYSILEKMSLRTTSLLNDFLKRVESKAEREAAIDSFMKLKDELHGSLFLTNDPLVKSGRMLPDVFCKIHANFADNKDQDYNVLAYGFLGMKVTSFPDRCFIYEASSRLAKENPLILIGLLSACSKTLPPTPGDILVFYGVMDGLTENPDLEIGDGEKEGKLPLETTSIFDLAKAPNPIYRLIASKLLGKRIAKNENELIDFYEHYIDETDPDIQSSILFDLEQLPGDAAKELHKKLTEKWR